MSPYAEIRTRNAIYYRAMLIESKGCWVTIFYDTVDEKGTVHHQIQEEPKANVLAVRYYQ